MEPLLWLLTRLQPSILMQFRQRCLFEQHHVPSNKQSDGKSASFTGSKQPPTAFSCEDSDCNRCRISLAMARGSNNAQGLVSADRLSEAAASPAQRLGGPPCPASWRSALPPAGYYVVCCLCLMRSDPCSI